MKILLSWLTTIISTLLPFLILFLLYKFLGKKVLIIFTLIGVVGVVLILFMIFGSGVGYKAVDKQKSNQYYTKNGEVYFVSMGNFFELGAVKIEGADIATFVVLAEGFAKDATHVYVRGDVFDEADPATFQPIRNAYAKDSKSVYLGKSVLEAADPASFELINERYAKDAKHIYYYGSLVEGADNKSFTYLWGDYAADASNVFHQATVLAPRKTEPQRVPGDSNDSLMLLNNSIYGKQGSVPEMRALDIADPDSFAVLSEHSLFSKDSQYVYRDLEKMPGADPETFEVINNYFAKDKNHEYYYGRTIVDTDPSIYASYKLDNEYDYYEFYPDSMSVMFAPKSQTKELARGHLRYKDRIFVYLNEINGVDVDSFQVLQDNYAKDKNSLYYRDEKIAGADAATFKIQSEDFSVDKNNVYWEHYIVKDVSPADFIYKDGMYGAKIDAVYAKLKINENRP